MWLFLAACETLDAPATTSTAPHERADTKTIELTDATLVPFPALASAARLPTADAMRGDLHARGIDELHARVHLCVHATGTIAEAKVAEGSGVPAFDAAIERDLVAWRYTSFRAPDTVRVCESVTVRYVL